MRKLYDLDVSEVSLVPKGANKKKFLIFKSASAVRKDELTTRGREHIKPSNFAIPSEEKYPIHDIEHARNALARVAQNGTSEEQAKVKAAVYRKYPSLKPEGKEGSDMAEKLKKMVMSVPEKTMKKVDKALKGEESIPADQKPMQKDAGGLSEQAKLALKASARILAPHKDEISTDHLAQVANAVGIGGGPENEGMPLEGSAGRETPLESDERADESLDMENAPEPMSDEEANKEQEAYLNKAFSIHVNPSDKEESEKHDEEELSGLTQKVEGDSGKDAEEASGLEKADDDDADEMEKSGDKEKDEDELEKSGDKMDEDEAEKCNYSKAEMSPEELSEMKASAHKAGMAAYKAAVDSQIKKLGSRMYPDEKELMKSKDGKPVEEEEVGKTSVSKSDSLDLTAVPEKVRPTVEQIFKSQKELVKKNAELEATITTMRKENRKKEIIAKVDSWKHLGGKEEIVKTLVAVDGTKAQEVLEKQFASLNAEKEAVSKGLFNEIGSSLPDMGGSYEQKIEAAVDSIVKKGGDKTRAQIYDEYIRTPEGQALYRELKNSRPGGV